MISSLFDVVSFAGGRNLMLYVALHLHSRYIIYREKKTYKRAVLDLLSH